MRKIGRDYPGGRVEYVYLVESYRDGARSRESIPKFVEK